MKKKSILLISFILVLSMIFIGCSKEEKIGGADVETSITVGEKKSEPKKEAEPVDVKIVMPYGTPTLSMIKMITENPSLGENVNASYEKIQATDVLVSMLIKAEPDIAMVPTNLGATIYNKGIDYKFVASAVWGTLYLVSSEDIKSMDDLKGKKISALGRNLTPDVVLRYILSENGLDPDKDVEIEYFSGASETASNFIAGNSNTALIPQPVLTKVLMKRKDAKVVLNIQDEWGKISDSGSFPQASIIVKSEFYDKHKDVVDVFLKEYEAGIKWLNENPLEAGKYYEALNIGLKAKMLEKAIPHCNIKYTSASDSKDALKTYLDILYKYNPKLLGGKEFNEEMIIEK